MPIDPDPEPSPAPPRCPGMRRIVLVATLALFACSSQPKAEQPSVERADTKQTAAEPVAKPSPRAQPPAAVKQATLGLLGLGLLRIGAPPPTDGRWASRGAQVSDTCRTISSPEFPGVYAIVEGGAVRRITLGKGSTVTLAEGIGVGADESDVRKCFAGFRAEPHKYESAPAKYLTTPNAGSGDPALRFEIGQDGKVSAIHVGTMPTLGYVEGCS